MWTSASRHCTYGIRLSDTRHATSAQGVPHQYTWPSSLTASIQGEAAVAASSAIWSPITSARARTRAARSQPGGGLAIQHGRQRRLRGRFQRRTRVYRGDVRNRTGLATVSRLSEAQAPQAPRPLVPRHSPPTRLCRPCLSRRSRIREQSIWPLRRLWPPRQTEQSPPHCRSCLQMASNAQAGTSLCWDCAQDGDVRRLTNDRRRAARRDNTSLCSSTADGSANQDVNA